ncbi:DUF4942 domain-containing protein [Photobacterium leiognathi]|uniref:DUF4942 domain-containing protein n=1 Tax=Photobacterium leiognathi TaxID=553611 RepID=UPI002981DA03|nr:DUF4942 domain-containing protein [Photobacterium leiognathi]
MTIITIDNSKKTNQLVRAIKENNQDLEWYPTTQEIVDLIASDINKKFSIKFECYCDEPEPSYHRSMSILDCGAGDGRVLEALTFGKKFAIEQSTILQQAMNKEIFVIGTDFKCQTLMDKPVDVIFCNPPYSEYDMWAEKIIREGHAEFAYLVIPHRWEMNQPIQLAIADRKAEVESIGLVDFYGADRKARAVVDVLRVSFARETDSYSYRRNSCRVDPFDLWFNNQFKFEANKSRNLHDYEVESAAKEKIKDEIHELAERKGLVHFLEARYNGEMKKLLDTYLQLNEIDGDLLSELGVKFDAVKEGLGLKIQSKKKIYWQELFDNLTEITEKLTSKSRERLLSKMQDNMSIDFTATNAYAVCIWVLKNANQYYDDQVIEVVEELYAKDNITNYVSNKKTLSDDAWRYNNPEYHDHYKLDYRIVAHRMGGIGNSDSWSYSHHQCGLQARTVYAINDLLAVANNLGFMQDFDCPRAENFSWSSGQMKTFLFKDVMTNKTETLFTCRAYMNGNLHFKFNQKFMQKLNVEFGRLKGWLRTAEEAATELDIPLEDVKAIYNCNLQLTAQNLPQLGFAA